MAEAVVAITGANGHVGANLVRSLLARRRRVRALTFGSAESLVGLDVERRSGDLRSYDFARRALADCEVVYHLAGVVALDGPRALYDGVNVHAVSNVVDACIANGVRRLVHLSSVRAMVEPTRTPMLADDRPLVARDHPDHYCRSKAEGERLVRLGMQRGLEVVVLAPTAIYGPHDYGTSAMTRVILDLCHRRWPVLLDGAYDWVDVRDVVELAIEAERLAPSGSKYQVAGRFALFPELARAFAEAAGVAPPPLVLPTWGAMPAAYAALAYSRVAGSAPFTTPEGIRVMSNKRRRFSHARATRELGYQPRPLNDSVEATLRCMRERGMLTAARGSARHA